MPPDRAFRTVRTLKGKEPLLHKLVFELRYRYGFTYLDRCGRIANLIQEQNPEWVIRPEGPNPQNAPFVSLENGCVFNYSALKLDLGIDQAVGGPAISENDVDHFVDQVDEVTSIVVDQLGLREFIRIGMRAWYLFACDSKEEAELWLQSWHCYSVEENLFSGFEGTMEALSVAVVIVGNDRRYRVAFNGVERQVSLQTGPITLSFPTRSLSRDQDRVLRRQLTDASRVRQFPGFAAMIDVDAFHDEPEVIDPREFVRTSIDGFLTQLERVAGYERT